MIWKNGLKYLITLYWKEMYDNYNLNVEGTQHQNHQVGMRLRMPNDLYESHKIQQLYLPLNERGSILHKLSTIYIPIFINKRVRALYVVACAQ